MQRQKQIPKTKSKVLQIIPRDISWLSFNERVLQEAADKRNSLAERIKFLGIYSNNLDEFYRVRVAALNNMILLGNKGKFDIEKNPKKILDKVHQKVNELQHSFEKIWDSITKELNKQKIFLKNENELTKNQISFLDEYFEDNIEQYIVPLMIQNISSFPVLNDKSIYLACVLHTKVGDIYSLVSVPVRRTKRFVTLPSPKGQVHIILLEDIIRLKIKDIFPNYEILSVESHIIKITRDAEFTIDNDLSEPFINKIEKGLKSRRKGRPLRFVFDKNINPGLLSFIIKRLDLTNKDVLQPGGRIHNFKNFMNFPNEVFGINTKPKKAPIPKEFEEASSILDAVKNKDVVLFTPYQNFSPIIHLLREAAMDARVQSIKITLYRLADNSKIIHALKNAARNGKAVTVVLELRARFDEEANLDWKKELEEDGVKVLLGVPDKKVHSKICIIKTKNQGKDFYYGFCGTGNLNENTAHTYSDIFVFTANQTLMKEINLVFNFLERPKTSAYLLKKINNLWVSPVNQKQNFIAMVNNEIKYAQKGKKALIIIKCNSISDEEIIAKLYEALEAGVELKLIVRGIYCLKTKNIKNAQNLLSAISIVDKYLEHSRVFYFHNNGKPKIYISSADLMRRNLNYRIEVGLPINDTKIAEKIMLFLNTQLSDNSKARVLNDNLSNDYTQSDKNIINSQLQFKKLIHLQQ